MAIMLLVGEAWIRRTKRSPEWWDSWVIMLWVSLLYARCTFGMLTDFVRESVRVTAAVRGDFLISAEVNTFTEHRGHGWSVKDMQHTYVVISAYPIGVLTCP